MMPALPSTRVTVAVHQPQPRSRWRGGDVAILVAVACYGAAMVIVAVGLLGRMAG